MSETPSKMENFTARDMEVMAKAWLCMTEAPKVDYDKLATLCGYTNVRSASNAWAAIKKKLIAGGEATSGVIRSPASAPSTKKRSKDAADGDGTPSKKPKGKKAQKIKHDEVEAALDGDNEEGDRIMKEIEEDLP